MLSLLFGKKKPVEVKENPKKLYVVDVLSSHRIRYVFECEEKELEGILMEETEDWVEFSQEFLGDKVVSYHTIKDEEQYLKMFNTENDYAHNWSEELKLKSINRR